MTKNLIILFDGTSNEIKEDRTNILRLYGTLEKSDRQLVYYSPGVGTFGAENAWLRFWRNAVEIWGLATGWGLDQNVKDAYRFLVESYDNGYWGDKKIDERDRIYIFGFSRGAYAARVLAGLVRAIGLIERRITNLIDYIYRAYKRIGEQSDDSFAEIRLYERMLETDRPPIRLLGVFDTVSSVIENGRYGIRFRHSAFTNNNHMVQAVRHTVAIDERRTMFRQSSWHVGQDYWNNPFKGGKAIPQDAREVWFAGVHCDVGGGYPEDQSQLAKIPLEWMIDECASMDLYFRERVIEDVVKGSNPEKKYVKPDDAGTVHISMSWAWAILEFFPRFKPRDSSRFSLFGITLPLFERRTIPEGARIHQSVINRIDRAGVKPENLPTSYVVEPYANFSIDSQ